MSNFDQVVKYLDLRRASKDVTTNTKPLSLNRSRAIKKLQEAFVIPQFTADNILKGAFLGQVNFSLDSDVSFLSITGEPVNQLEVTSWCVMCVRYRIGTTVYRYKLPISNNSSINDIINSSQFSLVVSAPQYTNELIKKNFAIEFWCLAPYDVSFPSCSIGPYTVLASKLRNPVNADEIGPFVDFTGTEVSRFDIDVDFPEPLPTPYVEASYWLNN